MSTASLDEEDLEIAKELFSRDVSREHDSDGILKSFGSVMKMFR